MAPADKIVYVYLAEATYTGTSELEWRSPEKGARHELLLFLSQTIDEPLRNQAIRELSRFGFEQFELTSGKGIQVESLNAPDMMAFQKHYEEALDAGSSVVWYPERLPHGAT